MTVWLNADQVAARLSVSKRTAMSIMYQMPYSVIGGTVRKRIRVSEGSLESWMAKKSNKITAFDSIQTGSKRKIARR